MILKGSHMTEEEMLALLEDIQKDVKAILSKESTAYHPVADVPILDPFWDYSKKF